MERGHNPIVQHLANMEDVMTLSNLIQPTFSVRHFQRSSASANRIFFPFFFFLIWFFI